MCWWWAREEYSRLVRKKRFSGRCCGHLFRSRWWRTAREAEDGRRGNPGAALDPAIHGRRHHHDRVRNVWDWWLGGDVAVVRRRDRTRRRRGRFECKESSA